MDQKLQMILENVREALSNAANLDMAKEIRIRYLGKKGEITALMKELGALSKEERPAFGQKINTLRNTVETLINEKMDSITEAIAGEKMAARKIDVTLSGKGNTVGALHPMTQVYREITAIFTSMGFETVEGPEIEFDKYNFEMLNIPKDHPARDMQDTFYVTEDIVLRTHTSPVQIRTMLKEKPPIRVICPGRVYRTDDVDATHSPVFHQIEGLYIDKGVTFADLKGTLNSFLRKFYGEHTQTKFRPGFFPFTEPSAEVDATCSLCKGEGCSACKGAGMVELLGCGMVHPVVLENCGIDPEVYSGFAFGLGLERMTNIKYGITDMRLLYENDVRFLKQFV